MSKKVPRVGQERRAGTDRLAGCLLYLVTPGRPAAGELNEFLPRVLEAGVDMVQLREKDAGDRTLLSLCEVVRRRTRQFDALFIVNDRVDLALASGADGVHLGQQDLPAAEARRQMGAAGLIGLSTHSAAQLRAALASEADYAAVGPVFATPTKPGRPATGCGLVRLASEFSQIPVFAIGGIHPGNIGSVIEAGARRICVVRALTRSCDPARQARCLKSALIAARDG